MKTGLMLLSLLRLMPVQAQHAVTFQLRSLPSYHSSDSPVFLAGSFNNWNPRDSAFRSTDGVIAIKLPKSVYEYKFTRGSWETGETAANGNTAGNRMLKVEGDTTIAVDILNWADHFPQQIRRSTAVKNVLIIDTAFYMPQLNRHRRVWIYLPSGYASTNKKYPVLYMQDGQNVFDDSTSYSGEWGVDETLDTLGSKTGESIVVAIDHGGERRINEYSPYDTEKWGRGEGDAYVDFIVKTLKPYVQKHYRVKRHRGHQAIAGSSMGGLISFYALLKYPKAFGAAGVFSPAFWVVPQLNDAISAKGRKVRGKIYFYAGKQESERMVPDMLAVFEQMSRMSKARMTTVIHTGGTHSENQWRQEFPLFYKWLFP